MVLAAECESTRKTGEENLQFQLEQLATQQKTQAAIELTSVKRQVGLRAPYYCAALPE